MEVVEEEGDEYVERISGHVGGMRAQQGRVESEPALEQQDRLLEQVVLPNELCKVLDEVQCEEATQLSDADVHGRVGNFELQHEWIGLVYEVHI